MAAFFVATLALGCITTQAAASRLAPPASEKKPAVDAYHGTSVTDDYRWLEDWADPAVKSWSEAQNLHARQTLDALPNVPAIRARMTALMTDPTPSYASVVQVKDKVFALKRQPPKQQPFLVVMDCPIKGTNERVLLDTDVLDPTHGTSMDWFRVSPDATMVAVSLSSGGSEAGDVRVFDVATGKEVYETVPRVNGGTAGGDVAWASDSKGFYYSRYPRAGERPDSDMSFFTQIYYHQLGTPTDQDRYELGATVPSAIRYQGFTRDGQPEVIVERLNPAGATPSVLAGFSIERVKAQDKAAMEAAGKLRMSKLPEDPPATNEEMATLPRGDLSYRFGFEFPRIAEIILSADPASGRLLSVVQNGDGSTFAIYLREEDGVWYRLADYPDKIVDAEWGKDSSVLLLSMNNAPKGKLLKLAKNVRKLDAAKVFVPESDAVIVNDFSGAPTVVSTSEYVFVEYQTGGPQEMRVFSHDGARVEGPKVDAISSTSEIVRNDYGNVLFRNVSYLTPTTWLTYDFKTRLTGPTSISTAPTLDTSAYEVVREFATSKDGTKVPIHIIRKKGITLDGSHPVMLTGYGGYGVNRTPEYRANWFAYLEQGFVVAEAVIRGGGEYGDTWHRQGNLTLKQNVFDDFAACMTYLVDAKYTTPARLSIVGGSNGGLLMGAMLTQHPEAFRATVSHVGIYDMLRVELSSNGAFNIPEFGTVKDKAQFDALYAYSPIHRVKDGVKYPSVLFMTGANDPRVDPMQSRKMTARLQAATAGLEAANPVLLRTSMTSGHGMGTKLSERIEQQVDQLAFLCKELGL